MFWLLCAVMETSPPASRSAPSATRDSALLRLTVTATAAAAVLAPVGAVVTVAPLARVRKLTLFSAVLCTSPFAVTLQRISATVRCSVSEMPTAAATLMLEVGVVNCVAPAPLSAAAPLAALEAPLAAPVLWLKSTLNTRSRFDENGTDFSNRACCAAPDCVNLSCSLMAPALLTAPAIVSVRVLVSAAPKPT